MRPRWKDLILFAFRPHQSAALRIQPIRNVYVWLNDSLLFMIQSNENQPHSKRYSEYWVFKKILCLNPYSLTVTISLSSSTPSPTTHPQIVFCAGIIFILMKYNKNIWKLMRKNDEKRNATRLVGKWKYKISHYRKYWLKNIIIIPPPSSLQPSS